MIIIIIIIMIIIIIIIITIIIIIIGMQVHHTVQFRVHAPRVSQRFVLNIWKATQNPLDYVKRLEAIIYNWTCLKMLSLFVLF